MCCILLILMQTAGMLGLISTFSITTWPLYCPNFSFLLFLVGYSWPTMLYPSHPFPSDLRLRWRGRGAAASWIWELSEREDMTQICLLASYLALVFQTARTAAFLCSGCIVIPMPEEGGGRLCGLLTRGGLVQDRCLTVGNHLFACVDVDVLSCWAGQWVRCEADMGNWVKFQAFSYIWSRTVSGLSFLQLILHLVCVSESFAKPTGYGKTI